MILSNSSNSTVISLPGVDSHTYFLYRILWCEQIIQGPQVPVAQAQPVNPIDLDPLQLPTLGAMNPSDD